MNHLRTFESFSSFLGGELGKITIAPAGTKASPGKKVVSQGETVKQLQQALLKRKFYAGKVTGVYDELTQQAVRKLQQNADLEVDGIVGPKTWEAITDGETPRTGDGTASTNSTKAIKATKAAAPTETSILDTIKGWFRPSDEQPDTSFLKQPATLLFDGSELHWMVNGKSMQSWGGTSGVTPLNSLTKWKSAGVAGNKYQKDKMEGPLPEGTYTLGAVQKNEVGKTDFTSTVKAIWDNNVDFKSTPYSKISWGNYRIKLGIAKGTNTYGRDSFYVHGGSLAGSHGCIDLTGDMDDFTKVYTAYCALRKKVGITLVAKYK